MSVYLKFTSLFRASVFGIEVDPHTKYISFLGNVPGFHGLSHQLGDRLGPGGTKQTDLDQPASHPRISPAKKMQLYLLE